MCLEVGGLHWGVESMMQADSFEAVRRGYTDLQEASPTEILNYFSTIDPTAEAGHMANIKGILFEQAVVDELQSGGLEAALFEETNHPDSDLFIMDDGEAIAEFQLKATDSASYIASTLEENPDIPIITTSEVVAQFDGNDMVIDSGISNSDLTATVSSTIFGGGGEGEIEDSILESASESLVEAVADATLPIPFSPFWLLGLPF